VFSAPVSDTFSLPAGASVPSPSPVQATREKSMRKASKNAVNLLSIVIPPNEILKDKIIIQHQRTKDVNKK
jgi:hypothetical protein